MPVGLSLELPVARPLLHVTLGADYSFAQDGCFEPMPHLSLWGFDDRTRVTRPGGCIHAFVAVLTFRGAERLAPGTTRGATGHRLDLVDCLGDDGARLLHRLRSAEGFSERCAILQACFRDLAHSTEARRASQVHDIADRIAANRLPNSVTAIARHIDVSERSLRNHFNTAFGVPPKRMLRIARLNRAVRALHPLGWGEGERRDVRLEFFDDAHFHHEFRHLTGFTPREFQSRKRASGDKLVYSLLGKVEEAGRQQSVTASFDPSLA